MCYVGKATKIFITMIAVLVVVGLIVGVGLFRRGLHKNHKCDGENCHSPEQSEPLFSDPCSDGNCRPPPYSNPIPATATAAPPYNPPTTANSCSGGNCRPPPYSNPTPATPPYNPPTGVVSQGPVHSKESIS